MIGVLKVFKRFLIRNKKVVIKIIKKSYSCKHCGKRAIQKNIKSISGYSRKNERFKFYLFKQTDSRDYSGVARENGLSYTSIKNSVNAQIDTMIEKAQLKTLDKIEAISIDEFTIKKKHKYAVALTDPINGKQIQVLSSPKKKDLNEYFNSWPDKLRVKEQDKQITANRKKFYKSRLTLLMTGENLDDGHQRLI